uniref:Uncharacterized protein n=1 Tax=Oryza nivara TaxID=4536 RepID=A0A0E0HYY1_ORYNI
MDPTPFAHCPPTIRCHPASIAVTIGCRPLPQRRLLSLLDQGRQPPSGVIHCHGRPPPDRAGQHPSPTPARHGQLHTLAVVEAECIIEAGNVIEGPM